ncbi:hypothetical protein PFISCL1PPCAC_11616, partial [Pristionchus fissidentatus]
MALPGISQIRRPGEEKKLIVKRDQIKLREPLHLKEEQFQKIRTFNDSDFDRAHVDVYPPTYIVHSKTSDQKFGLNKCIIVTTSSTTANIRVFDAPKFCCNKPAAPDGHYRNCDSGGAYKSVEKSDICFIMPIACPIDRVIGTMCWLCGDRRQETFQLSLIALRSGYFACSRCWLEHHRWSPKREALPIPWPLIDSPAMSCFMDQRTTCFLCGKRDDCKQEV